MASCSACGANITHAKTETGENVPIERWTDTDGPDRYRIIKLGPPLIVAKVAHGSPIDAYPDHRRDCPDHGNGLYGG
jgi:hypothetical protein